MIDEERGVVVEDVENGEAMEGEARGVKRKKTTSAIWGTAAMKQGDTAVCLVCKSVFKITQGNTTGIRSHRLIQAHSVVIILQSSWLQIPHSFNKV